jgi:hypothetical protein
VPVWYDHGSAWDATGFVFITLRIVALGVFDALPGVGGVFGVPAFRLGMVPALFELLTV